MMTDDEEGPGYNFILGLIMTVMCSLGSFFAITVLHEILGRRGIPTVPILWVVVGFPWATLLMFTEEKVQQSRWWPKVKELWYAQILIVWALIPAVLTVIFPWSLWDGLPRGGPSGTVFTFVIACGVAALLRGMYAARKHKED